MQVRIYRPSKTAMQSGRADTRNWVLEFEPTTPRRIEPLMGWTSSADPGRQVRIAFASKEEAVAYAEKHGFAYSLEGPHERSFRPKSYADNFRYDRPARWTH